MRQQRKLKDQEIVEPVQTWENDGSVAVEEKKKFLPWQGDKDQLEPAEMNENGRVVKPGTPRFFVNKDKLIAVYLNGKGVARRLYAMLKIPAPTDVNDVHAIARRQRIMAFRALLKKNGIPGI